jgi:hypothetical protein
VGGGGAGWDQGQRGEKEEGLRPGLGWAREVCGALL